jgi:hypothetical protein
LTAKITISWFYFNYSLANSKAKSFYSIAI